jgi:predicted house-cleaning noncanonical NTP pyrophosphatase (MazG superfamily)
MLDIVSARLRTHMNNIARYRRLLETKLTELEREYIQRRLLEEESNLEALGR